MAAAGCVVGTAFSMSWQLARAWVQAAAHGAALPCSSVLTPYPLVTVLLRRSMALCLLPPALASPRLRRLLCHLSQPCVRYGRRSKPLRQPAPLSQRQRLQVSRYPQKVCLCAERVRPRGERSVLAASRKSQKRRLGRDMRGPAQTPSLVGALVALPTGFMRGTRPASV